MKQFPILACLLLIPALALFGVGGCSPKKDDKPAPPPPADKDKDKDGGKTKKTDITTAPDATVKGVVKFKGTPPDVKVNLKVAEHKDAKAGLCGTAADQHEQLWIIGKDDGVANVIVMLAPPADKKFKKLDDELLKTYKHPVVIDQPFCNYIPHVVALFADYQPLEVKNTAKMNHNVKIEAGSALGGTKDLLVLPGKDTGEVKLGGGPETIINASCSIHTWMNAKIGLFNNPYFAVTDKDGNFEIKNVPIDEELTVYVWHESFGGGQLKDKHEAEKLKTKAGDNEVKLEIK